MVSSSQHQLHCLHVASRVRAPAAAGLTNTQRWGRNLKYRPSSCAGIVVGDEEEKSQSYPLSSPSPECASYSYFTPAPGSWLLTGVSGSRVQADMSPVLHRCSVHWGITSDNVTMSGYQLSQTISNRSVTLAPDDSSIHRVRGGLVPRVCWMLNIKP